MAKKDKISVSKQTGDIQPPKLEPTDVCNSRLSKGGYCQKSAGWGTQHPGTGRCKLHGGSSTGRPRKTFSAAEYLNKGIIKDFEEISTEDPTALSNLDNEINVVKGHFYEYLKNPKKDKNKKDLPPDVASVKKYMDTLVNLVKAKATLEGKIQHKKIPTQIIVLYVNKVTNILERHIKDPILRKQISQAMREISLEDMAN